MEHLTVYSEPAFAAACVETLCRKTGDGCSVPAPETLGELFPELGDLMRDGGGGLLSLPVLQRTYAALTTAFAGLCSGPLDLPEPPGDSATGRCSLAAACAEYCTARALKVQEAFAAMHQTFEAADPGAVEVACNAAILADPTAAEPFLVRAGARLHVGDRWCCLEDIHMYLWWCTRQGFKPREHATAYWRMAEAYIGELEARVYKEGALLDDSMFHCLVDQADSSLRVACLYDSGNGLAKSAAARHFMQRIEDHRAARRTAGELVERPVVADMSGRRSDGTDGTEPCAGDYAVPWPVDLSAGLPDTALFSRMPTVGSSQQHDPVDVLILDFQSILDLLPTLQTLATRATEFAQRNAECLHWNYRPKPLHVRVQAPAPERLAHTLLCIIIAKQVGHVSDGEQDDAIRSKTVTQGGGTSFTMAETAHDRFLCSLLTSVLCCRTLTPVQRAEVDRLLSLLVFASMNEEFMHRAFPMLELDDGRKSSMAEDAAEQRPEMASEGDAGTGGFSQQLGLTLVAENVWGSSVLLSRLRSIWLGWLSAAGGEQPAAEAATAEAEAQAEDKVPPRARRARVDVEAVHRAARASLLEPDAAACTPAELAAAAADGGRGSGLPQRRLWALLGYLPPGAPPGGGSGSEPSRKADSHDPTTLLQPVDPRLRWLPILKEFVCLSPQDACLNPCLLKPFSWEYDASAATDPFKVFSWRLRSGRLAEADATGWQAATRDLVRAADPPLPSPGSCVPSAAESIWELLMGQLKVLSAVFNAFEAADSAKARAMVQSLTQEEPSDRITSSVPGNRRASQGPKLATVNENRAVHVHISSQLRQRVMEEEAEEQRELVFSEDIQRELDELKQRRHEVCLDLELRDYVMLTAVREKESDWWGKGAEHAVAYAEAMGDCPAAATWNPAPVACAPLRCRLSFLTGSPRHAAMAASSRGLSFDVIDARALLVSSVGPLGVCSWFDSLLKPTSYAYIQTRHCEELFLEALEERRLRPRSAQTAEATSDPRGEPAAPPPAAIPPAAAELLRGGGGLVVNNARWPSRWEPEKSTAAPRRAVMAPGGRMQWTSTPRRKDESGIWATGAATPRSRFAQLASKQFSAKFSAPTPMTERSLLHRLLPDTSSTLTLKPGRSPVVVAPDSVAAVLASRQPTWKSRPYTTTSAMFERLVKESISADVSSAQMQCLMGVAVRAEPLCGELALSYFGTAHLPVRHDFLPWDSSQEVAGLRSQNWPGDARRFTGQALGGMRPVPRRARGTDGAKCSLEPLAAFGRHWTVPSDAEQAAVLGPRLLRVRRLGGHPSLDFSPETKRCANAAFCRRVVRGRDVLPAVVGGDAPEPCCCTLCDSAWYCSPACQAVHRTAHASECQQLRELRAASTDLESRGLEVNKAFFAKLLEDILARQFNLLSDTGGMFNGAAFRDDAWRSGRPPSASADSLGGCGQATDVCSAAPVHTAAGVVRLMTRWLGAAGRTPALREVIDAGLIFCIITGLSVTRLFSARKLSDHAVVSILAHRMALHIAASHGWRALAPALVPPRNFQDQGLAGIECAQYTAYSAFLKPCRRPFAELRPLLPIVCIVWGDQALQALAALEGAGAGSASAGKSGDGGSFLKVAAEHIANIQIMDNVDFDVLTGRVIVSLYTSVVEGSILAVEDGSDDAWVLLVDAARGMQAVARPIPARDLHRCAL